jgi:hypothetical protein
MGRRDTLGGVVDAFGRLPVILSVQLVLNDMS